MSLILPHLQPRLISSLLHEPTSIYPNLKPLAFSAKPKPKTKFQSIPSVSRSNTRFRNTYVLKSASVNGFPLQSDSEVSPRDAGVKNAELSEKLRRWIAFVRSVLPGGSWWSFSEDVDVVLTARPVTVLRALQRMWELIAKDRWIILAAFATLIITADAGQLTHSFANNVVTISVEECRRLMSIQSPTAGSSSNAMLAQTGSPEGGGRLVAVLNVVIVVGSCQLVL